MKLTTKKGQLDLPKDFSLTMERNNPFLSDEGDASIPATLPASSNNLEILEHRERIDRARRYFNKEEAILEVGPVQKHGQLVIDTVNRSEGFDASLAIDNSDLYVKSKNKSLKEIFAGWKGGIGMNIPFSSIDDACQYMISIYNGTLANTDFAVFPVAVSPYDIGEEDNRQTVYQYNNEAGGQFGLVYEERIVREGDINMLVPKGYGIAPFLKLQRLLLRLFEVLGYTVDFNCFDEAPFYSQIVIVHNCADCLCNPQSTLYYKDLVPSCTLSEFLEWLLAKFHVQPVVNSETKRVRIDKMDAILNMVTGIGGYDQDISGLVEGDWTVQLNPSKRIVLTPSIEIEGSEAAAETFDKLLEKYGGYVDINEQQFWSLNGPSPTIYDCLVKRKSTGMFYLLERSLSSGDMTIKPLGTNYFKYDRQNSDESEDFSQVDVMPLMLCGPKCETAPFIGDRIHKHTSYNGGTDDSVQKIIAVQAHTLPGHFAYATTGTTQESIPYNNGVTYYSFWFGMDNYSMYKLFWQNYNNLILNNVVRLKGRVKYSVAQFLNLDMSVLKLCDGQRLLPEKASLVVSENAGLTEADFIRVELFMDGVSDDEIKPISGNGLKWQVTGNAEELAHHLYQTEIAHGQGTTQYISYSIDFTSDLIDVFVGIPLYEGETREISAQATLKITYREREIDHGHVVYNIYTDPFPNQIINFLFVAVPA